MIGERPRQPTPASGRGRRRPAAQPTPATGRGNRPQRAAAPIRCGRVVADRTAPAGATHPPKPGIPAGIPRPRPVASGGAVPELGIRGRAGLAPRRPGHRPERRTPPAGDPAPPGRSGAHRPGHLPARQRAGRDHADPGLRAADPGPARLPAAAHPGEQRRPRPPRHPGDRGRRAAPGPGRGAAALAVRPGRGPGRRAGHRAARRPSRSTSTPTSPRTFRYGCSPG